MHISILEFMLKCFIFYLKRFFSRQDFPAVLKLRDPRSSSSAGIKGVHHHTWAIKSFSLYTTTLFKTDGRKNRRKRTGKTPIKLK